MKRVILAAIAVAVAGMPAGNGAQAAKKIHKPRYVPEVRAPVIARPDLAWGNAAAGGNNANSMSGDNSAANNANGRTSGAGWGGM